MESLELRMTPQGWVKEDIKKFAHCCYNCKHFTEEGGCEGHCGKLDEDTDMFMVCRYFRFRF